MKVVVLRAPVTVEVEVSLEPDDFWSDYAALLHPHFQRLPIGNSDPSLKMDDIHRNQSTASSGFTGRHPPEYAAFNFSGIICGGEAFLWAGLRLAISKT